MLVVEATRYRQVRPAHSLAQDVQSETFMEGLTFGELLFHEERLTLSL